MNSEVFSPDVYSKKDVKKRLIVVGITQKEFAKKLGVSEQFLSRVLNGKVSGKHLMLKATLFLRKLRIAKP